MARQETVSVQFKAGMNITEIQQQLKMLQNNLNNLNIKDARLKNEFTSLFNELEKEFKHYQELVQNGFKTKADVTGFDKSVKQISSLMNRLVGTFDSVDNIDLNKIFYLDSNTTKEIDRLRQRIKELNDEIKSVNTGNLQNFKNLFNQLTLDSAKKGGQQISNLVNKGEIEEAIRLTDEYIQKYSRIIPMLQQQGKADKTEQNIKILQQIKTALAELDLTKLNQLNQELEQTQQQQKELETSSLSKYSDQLKELANDAKAAADATDDITRADKEAADAQRQFNNEIDNIKGKITYFFGLENAINLLRTAIRNAFESVKELDAAMTETAVVTDFTVGDMWEALPEYTKVANELGATTLGAYETMTLFYQQGLETNQAFEVGTETMKMARIANMDYAEATDLMTAALRGFNMELNEVSAQRINDVYSELAAITAADTQEIGVAMSKTASIAANANMEFETTAALLSQIIETTREAPETAGTAMKTIIARFSEVKELFSEGQLTGTDSEGEEININKIDAALKNVGISLNDFLTGKQGLDDVFLQLAERWDTLDLATQRYIATVAAGSRQQSRFLAMMSNYDRTMELVNAAYNSTGASQQQFEKTTDSLQAKLNKLSNAWNEFTMGLANNKLIKLGIDILTQFLTALNNLTDVLGEGTSGILKFVAAFGLFKGGRKLFNGLLGSFSRFWAEANGKAGKAGDTVSQTFIERFNQSIKNNYKNINLDNILNTFFDTIEKPFKTPISGLQELAKYASDASTIGIEKFYQLGQSYGYTTEQLQAFSKAIIAGNTVQEAAIALVDKETASMILNTKATDSNTIAQQRNKVAQAAAAKGNFTKSTVSNIGSLLFGTQKTAGQAATALQSGIKGTNLFSKGLSKVIGLLGAIPLPLKIAIPLVIGLGVALEKIIETPAEKIERLNNELDNLQDTLQDSEQALSNLSSSINSIQNVEDSFDGLIQGTIEWKEALIEANQQVLDLIEQYPQLAQYVEQTNSGRLTIPDSTLNTFYNEKLQNQQNLQIAAIQKQAELLAAEQEQIQGSIISAEKILQESKEANITRINEDEKQPRRNTETKVLSSEETQRQENRRQELQNEYDSYSVQIESLMQTAYQSLLSDVDNLSSKGKQNLSKILGELYSPEKFQELVKEAEEKYDISEETLRETYQDTFGVEASDELDKEDLQGILAEYDAVNQIRENTDTIINTLQNLNLSEEMQDYFLQGISDEGFTYESFQELLKATSLTPETIQNTSIKEIFNLEDDSLLKIAEAWGTDVATLQSNFQKSIDNITWAMDTFGDKINLSGEAYDDLITKLQDQKSQFDENGTLDFSGLTWKELEAIDLTKFEEDLQLVVQEAFNNAVITKRDENIDSFSPYKQENGNLEVSRDELQDAIEYADISQESFKVLREELLKINPVLKENEQLFNAIAESSLRLQKDLKRVNEALAENEEALSQPKYTIEYAEGLDNMVESVSALVGTSVDPIFIETNLPLIKEAAAGSTEAINELLKLSGKQLLIDADLGLPEDEMNELLGYIDLIDGYDLEVGTELNNQGFINGLNELLLYGKLGADDLNAIFKSIGFEPDVDFISVPFVPYKFQKRASNLGGIAGSIASVLGGVQNMFGGTFTVPYIRGANALGNISSHTYKPSSTGGSGGSSGGGGSSTKEEPWDNTFDKLYNLIEDINEEERIRNDLELEFNRITEDGIYSSGEILKNLQAQEASLKRQQILQQQLLSGRKSEMQDLLAENRDLQKYASYNWSDMTIEINWNLINSVTDNDLGQRIEDYVSELERIQESMDEADDALEDIKDQIEELKDVGKDEYEELENTILEAIILREQQFIDSLSTISNSIDEANSSLISSLSDSINRIRQVRENEETEQEIADTQNYLAYLQRDTSNANRLEILQTQDELEQQEQDYTDTLIDQKISELEQQNELASQQRQQQIEILQAQLDRDKEYGLLWTEVKELLKNGVTNDGVLISNSDLDEILKLGGEYSSLSSFGQAQWSDDIKNLIEMANVWLVRNTEAGLNGNKNTSGGNSSNSNNSSNSSSTSSSSTSNKTIGIGSLINAGNAPIYATSSGRGKGTQYYSKDPIYKIIGENNGYWSVRYHKLKSGITGWFKKSDVKAYKKGGLADFTGPAWLDGTKSKPELVLNAQDTQNFIALKDVLSDLMSSNFSNNTPKGGDNYYEVNIQVDELSNDYDVDQLAARVKKIINDDGRYRNVNSINLMR